MHIRRSARIFIALIGVVFTEANADGLDDGDLAWKYHCTTCHGDAGIANSSRYPNLAGQNEAYLISRLRYFRDKTEPGNQMNAQAAPLSDEDIERLAKYFNRGGA